MNLYALIRRVHRRWCGSCRAGNTWLVGLTHIALVTPQYEREQAALKKHRREMEQRREDRRAVVLAAARGQVSRSE